VVDVLDFMDKESVANSQKSWEKTNRSFSQFFNEAAAGIKVNPSLSIANPNQGFLLPKKSIRSGDPQGNHWARAAYAEQLSVPSGSRTATKQKKPLNSKLPKAERVSVPELRGEASHRSRT